MYRRKTVARAVALLVLTAAQSWAGAFGLFPGLSALISRSDFIVVAYIADSLPTIDLGTGSIQKVRILASIKGDLKSGTEATAWVRDLPFSDSNFHGTLHPRGWHPGNRMVLFLMKNDDPKRPYQYRMLNLSGDSFGVSPTLDLSKLTASTPRKNIELILRESLKYETAELKEYGKNTENYLGSK
jgi:hypothetical protein